MTVPIWSLEVRAGPRAGFEGSAVAAVGAVSAAASAGKCRPKCPLVSDLESGLRFGRDLLPVSETYQCYDLRRH